MQRLLSVMYLGVDGGIGGKLYPVLPEKWYNVEITIVGFARFFVKWKISFLFIKTFNP